jgi:hypothetical protein
MYGRSFFWILVKGSTPSPKVGTDSDLPNVVAPKQPTPRHLAVTPHRRKLPAATAACVDSTEDGKRPGTGSSQARYKLLCLGRILWTMPPCSSWVWQSCSGAGSSVAGKEIVSKVVAENNKAGLRRVKKKNSDGEKAWLRQAQELSCSWVEAK